MTRKAHGFALVLAGAGMLTVSAPAQGMFAIDALSPSTAFVSTAAVLTPGPAGGPPTVLYACAALGLPFPKAFHPRRIA
jgi:hypothetical protein